MKSKKQRIPTVAQVLAQQNEQQMADREKPPTNGGASGTSGSALIPLGAAPVPAEKSRGLVRYAKTSGPTWFGDLLRHNGKSGGYTAGGQQGRAIETGRVLVAIVPETFAGLVKWVNGELAGQEWVPACDFVAEDMRATLDEQDVSKWQKDDRGSPIDPWKEAVMIPMVDPNTREEFTFSSSNAGGVGAAKRLVNAYNKQIAAAPETTSGCLPVIALHEDFYVAKNRAHGKIFFPILKGLDWIRASDLLLPREPGQGEEPPADDGQLPLAG